MSGAWTELERIALRELEEEEKRNQINSLKEKIRNQRKKDLTEKKISFNIVGYEVSFTYKKRKK